MVALVSIFAVAVGLLTVLVAGLLRSHAEILRELQSLGVNLDPDAPVSQIPTEVTAPARPDGAPAIDVAGVDPSGAPVAFAVADVDHRTLLAFLSSTCLTCRGFWEAFADRRLAVPGGARLLIVTKGSEAESPSMIRKLAPSGVHTVLSSTTWEAYGIPVAPYFVLVESSGAVIGEGAAATWEHVSELMGQSLADMEDRQSRVEGESHASRTEPARPSLYPDRGE